MQPQKSTTGIFVFERDNVKPGFWNENVDRTCCWLDTEPFDGPIYSFPIRKEHDRWTVRGIFCSLHCVKRYIIENSFMNTSVFTLFSLMCVQLYGVKGEVVPAPPYQILQKFSISGQKALSLQEFRSVGPDQKSITVVEPPVYPFRFPDSYVCEEQKGSDKLRNSEEGFHIIHQSNNVASSKTTPRVSNSVTENSEPMKNAKQPALETPEQALQCPEQALQRLLSTKKPSIANFPSRQLTSLACFYPEEVLLPSGDVDPAQSMSEGENDEDDDENDDE